MNEHNPNPLNLPQPANTADAHVRELLRTLVAEKGKPILWDEDAIQQYPNNPEWHVSTYSWCHYPAHNHIREDGCRWIVSEGTVAVEQTYSQFQDTFAGNKDEIGINVSPVACACGEYTNMTLRLTGSLNEILTRILPQQPPTIRL